MCEKIAYENERQANNAINLIKKNSSRSHIPKRAYFCKQCNKWHLTSYKEEFTWLTRKNKKKTF